MFKVTEVYADLNPNKIIEKDVYIATILVSRYAKCGTISEAQEIFEQPNFRFRMLPIGMH